MPKLLVKTALASNRSLKLLKAVFSKEEKKSNVKFQMGGGGGGGGRKKEEKKADLTGAGLSMLMVRVLAALLDKFTGWDFGRHLQMRQVPTHLFVQPDHHLQMRQVLTHLFAQPDCSKSQCAPSFILFFQNWTDTTFAQIQLPYIKKKPTQKMKSMSSQLKIILFFHAAACLCTYQTIH